MSIWTHVTGIIKFRCFIDNKHEDIKNIMGKIVTFDDLISESEEDCITILPMGSEGSLQWTLSETENSYQIVITGDLRNYENEKELKDWFKKIIKELDKIGLWIRDFILNIDIECESTYTIGIPKINKNGKESVQIIKIKKGDYDGDI